MSLQVWLPLNGNLNNQGLSNVTASNNGAVINNDGKIGKCYEFDGTDDRIYINNISIDCSELSLSLWFNRSNSSNNEGYIFSLNGGSGYSDCAIGLDTSSATTLVFVAGGAANITTSINYNVWNHAVVTFKNGTTTAYLNGEKINTSSGNTLTRSLLTIGARANNSSGANVSIAYPFNGKINDVRLYNHCLSEKEVKELARGLVLHYPLSRPIDNLLRADSNNIANWTAEGLTKESFSEDIFNGIKLTSGNTANQRIYYGVQSDVWQKDQVYKVSFWAKSNTAGTQVNMSRSIVDFSEDVTLTTSWKKYIVTVTSTATPGGGTLSFRVVNTNRIVYISNIKLEPNVYTGYVPGSNTDEYSRLEFNNDIEYDISGYGNNGNITGNINLLSNSAIHSMYYSLGTTAHIQRKSLPLETQSVSFWIYPTAKENGIYFIDTNSKLGFGFWNSNQIIVSSNSYAIAPFKYNDVSINTWSHIVLVKQSNSIKMYVNGQEKTPISGTNYWVASSEEFRINGRSDETRNINVNMSDFRAYVTALSASDVQELYAGGSL